MRALVTGGGGFLGQYIVEQLVARGDQVRVLSRSEYPEVQALGVEMRQGDLREESTVVAACQEMDVVFHTAAVAGIWGPWDHFHGVNTLGTNNVLVGCRQQGVPRLVYTSSPSVTFDGSDQEGVDESVPYPSDWLCHYPHTKALGEQAVLAANGNDLMTCALRPHLIWGPRDRHLIPRLLERARRGRLRRGGTGENLVDTIYVENAAEAHLRAADALEPGAAVCGNAYFISQGVPVNCWQWIDEILSLAELPAVQKSISFRTAWRVGAVFETVFRIAGVQREPLMTRFLAAQLAKHHHFDISRARADFAYEPRFSIAEGMQRLGAEIRSEAS